MYSGKHGCACGCRGKHTFASAFRAVGGQERGYLVSDEEVNDRTVKMIVNKLNRSDDTRSIGDGVFVMDTASRTYAVYTTNR